MWVKLEERTEACRACNQANLGTCPDHWASGSEEGWKWQTLGRKMDLAWKKEWEWKEEPQGRSFAQEPELTSWVSEPQLASNPPSLYLTWTHTTHWQILSPSQKG